jgi:hypothetical protein
MKNSHQNQKRTAIVYFGSLQEDYLKLLQSEDRSSYIEYIQAPLQQQLIPAMHHDGCLETSHLYMD